MSEKPPIGSVISNALWGCLEIPLFMRVGLTRFGNSKRDAIISLIVSILTIPVSSYLAQINPTYTRIPYFKLIALFVLEHLLLLAIYFSLLFYLCRALKRVDALWHAFTIYNWLAIPSLVIITPFALLVFKGAYTFDEMNALFLTLMLYGFAFSGFYLTYVLRLNWMLGTSLVIAHFILNDGLNKLIF